MAQPQPAQAQPGGEPSAQEMDMYRRAMLAAMKIIYTDPKPFLDMIAGASDPTKGILLATNIILQKIRQSVKGLPPQVIDQMAPKAAKLLGPMIGKLLLELANVAGVLDQGASTGAPAGNTQAPRGLVARAQSAAPQAPGYRRIAGYERFDGQKQQPAAAGA